MFANEQSEIRIIIKLKNSTFVLVKYAYEQDINYSN